jgi:hypothetical protein
MIYDRPSQVEQRAAAAQHADRNRRHEMADGLSGVRLRRFAVLSVGYDHLVCRTWDGATQGSEDVLVAKPLELRKTGWHGATIDGVAYTYSSGTARSASKDGDSEDQVIGPPYTVSETTLEIVAMAGIAGGTGVDVDGVAVRWIDLNLAARRWEVECT